MRGSWRTREELEEEEREAEMINNPHVLNPKNKNKANTGGWGLGVLANVPFKRV